MVKCFRCADESGYLYAGKYCIQCLILHQELLDELSPQELKLFETENTIADLQTIVAITHQMIEQTRAKVSTETAT